MKKDFELLDHTADIKLRVYGGSIQELFCNALNGMFQSIEPFSDSCLYEHGRFVCKQLPVFHVVEVTSADRELLLVDFLSHALYLSDVHNEAYFNVEFHELTDTYLRATVQGVVINGFNVEIKAVTYNDLFIKEIDGQWVAEIVFDI